MIIPKPKKQTAKSSPLNEANPNNSRLITQLVSQLPVTEVLSPDALTLPKRHVCCFVKQTVEKRTVEINPEVALVLQEAISSVVQDITDNLLSLGTKKRTVQEEIKYISKQRENSSVIERKAINLTIKNLSKDKETLSKKLERLNSSFNNFSCEKSALNKTILSTDKVRNTLKKGELIDTLKQRDIIKNKIESIDSYLINLKTEQQPKKHETFTSQGYLLTFEKDKEMAKEKINQLDKKASLSFERMIVPTNDQKMKDIRKKDLVKRKTYLDLLEKIKLRELSEDKSQKQDVYYYQRLEMKKQEAEKRENDKKFKKYFSVLKKRKEYFRPISREELNQFERSYVVERETREKNRSLRRANKVKKNEELNEVVELSIFDNEKLMKIYNQMKKKNYARVVKDFFMPEVDENKMEEVVMRTKKKLERYTLKPQKKGPELLPKPTKIVKKEGLDVPLHLPKISLLKENSSEKGKQYKNYLTEIRSQTASNRSNWKKIINDKSYSPVQNRQYAMEIAIDMEKKADDFIKRAAILEDRNKVEGFNSNANELLIQSLKGKLAVLKSLAD